MNLKLSGDGASAYSPKYHTHDALTSMLYKSINYQKYDLVIENMIGEDVYRNIYIHLHERHPRSEELTESIVWWMRYQVESNGRIHRGLDDFVIVQIPLHVLTDKVVSKILTEG